VILFIEPYEIFAKVLLKQKSGDHDIDLPEPSEIGKLNFCDLEITQTCEYNILYIMMCL